MRRAASSMRPVRSNSRRAAKAVSDAGRTPESSDSSARERISRTVTHTRACLCASLPPAPVHNTGEGLGLGSGRVRWAARSESTRIDQRSSVSVRGRYLLEPCIHTVAACGSRSAAVMCPSSEVCAPASSNAAVAACRVGAVRSENNRTSAASSSDSGRWQDDCRAGTAMSIVGSSSVSRSRRAVRKNARSAARRLCMVATAASDTTPWRVRPLAATNFATSA
ncbi:Uncharacterised protein [Mycobacteroides abscessus subsp. abscessus]|nr:Uncharacterised protein [Mycobacteroides abscessus subsp. abscessus]